MTLHWWMHWFWVTMLLVYVGSSGSAKAAPQAEGYTTTDMVEQHGNTDRQQRALYFGKPDAATTRSGPVDNTTERGPEDKQDVTVITDQNGTTTNGTDNVQPIHWTAINNTESNTSTGAENATLPNIKEVTYTNLTGSQNSTFANKKRNLTRPDFIQDDANIDGVSESRIVTEKPLSLETAFVQTRIPPNIESSRRVIDPREGGMDTGAIAGIAFAALVLTALAGSTAFILYRRRYLNKPQTLNDKCSNPDSSGYLDDSTIRDNSEEMYSLDNDSFLNSLEAMTIQNYWTDTVKHTKL